MQELPHLLPFDAARPFRFRHTAEHELINCFRLSPVMPLACVLQALGENHGAPAIPEGRFRRFYTVETKHDFAVLVQLAKAIQPLFRLPLDRRGGPSAYID